MADWANIIALDPSAKPGDRVPGPDGIWRRDNGFWLRGSTSADQLVIHVAIVRQWYVNTVVRQQYVSVGYSTIPWPIEEEDADRHFRRAVKQAHQMAMADPGPASRYYKDRQRKGGHQGYRSWWNPEGF